MNTGQTVCANLLFGGSVGWMFVQASLVMVLSWALVRIRLRKAPDRDRVIATLDRVLEAESSELRKRTDVDPLRITPTGRVKVPAGGIGWGLRPGRVEIVRTVRAAIKDGYRIRVRAFARDRFGRTLMRSVDVDLTSRR